MHDYRMLNVAASILRFVGWLVITIAVVSAVVTLLGIVTVSAGGTGAVLLSALGGVLQGVLILAGSEVVRLLFEFRSRIMQLDERVRQLDIQLRSGTQ